MLEDSQDFFKPAADERPQFAISLLIFQDSHPNRRTDHLAAKNPHLRFGVKFLWFPNFLRFCIHCTRPTSASPTVMVPMGPQMCDDG